MQTAKFSCFVLFLILFPVDHFHGAVSANEFFTSSSGVTFGRSSIEPKYRIQFHSANAAFHPDNGQESVDMSNNEGKNYMCFLPIIEETKSTKSIPLQNSTTVIVEADRKFKLKTPDELIDVIKGECLYRHEGWWSYEFCHQKHLRQLHLDENMVAQEFFLGVFDPEATIAFNQNNSDTSMLKDPRYKDASQRYHPHQYTNGSICDLTNQPREAEIRFVCSESAIIISSIKEISTCKYAVTIQCPMLCKHPMYQQGRSMWHTIHCNEIPGEVKEPLSVMDSEDDTEINIVPDDSGRFAT